MSIEIIQFNEPLIDPPIDVLTKEVQDRTRSNHVIYKFPEDSIDLTPPEAQTLYDLQVVAKKSGDAIGIITVRSPRDSTIPATIVEKDEKIRHKLSKDEYDEDVVLVDSRHSAFLIACKRLDGTKIVKTVHTVVLYFPLSSGRGQLSDATDEVVPELQTV